MKKMMVILLAVLTVGIICFSGCTERDTHGSPNSCAICGKGPANKLTEDQTYYCSKHYPDAWNYYYGNK